MKPRENDRENDIVSRLKRTIRRSMALGGLAVVIGLGAGYAWRGTRSPIIPQPPPGLEPLRWVPLEGTVNMRDIGGYRTADGRRVRWNLVYRSDELAQVTDEGCELFADLGIRLVVDYRNRVVSSPLFGGDRACIHRAAEVLLAPVRLDDSGRPTYVATAENHRESYRRTFERLADPGSLPMVYHCNQGKDRTGITTALLLTLLGVERETVIADYMLSHLAYPPANRQAVVDLLDEVQRPGGIETYLANLGIPADTQRAIRRNLLE